MEMILHNDTCCVTTCNYYISTMNLSQTIAACRPMPGSSPYCAPIEVFMRVDQLVQPEPSSRNEDQMALS